MYSNIPELPALMERVKSSHDQMLDIKRAEINEVIRQCLEEIHTASVANADTKRVSEQADEYYETKQEQIAHGTSLAIMDSYVKQIFDYKDKACEKIEALSRPKQEEKPQVSEKPKKVLKVVYRQSVFPSKKIETQEELNEYIARVREQLSALINNSEGIELK